MSQSVDKLKELLFQPESDAIASLSKRIDAVFDRAGTTERFQASVATVLDGALREAEVAHHDQVASAIAPLIVKTVKTEIHNSTDDLVEALYPATGRMVKAYVASAIKDLTDEINRRLEGNPVMLRLNALLSGRSAAELAIAQSQRLAVEDVFLIRRATGELVARWPEGGAGSNHDHVLGGVLTAINEFTAEAFKAEGSALRQIDLGESRVYLRVSPTYLLAAQCTGSAPLAAEKIFDDEFLALMDRHNAVIDAGARTDATPLLQDLSLRLEARIGELHARATASVIKPLPILVSLIVVPLVAWLAWSYYVDYRISRVRTTTEGVLASNAGMQGYPTEIKVKRNGRVVLVSGLAPTEAVKSGVIGELRALMPDVEVVDQLSPVPTGGVDIGPVIAALRLDQAAFETSVKAESAKRERASALRSIQRAQALIEEAAAQPGRSNTADITALGADARDLAALLGADLAPAEFAAAGARARTLANRLAVLSVAGLDANGPAAAPATGAAGGPEGLGELALRAAEAAQALVSLHAVRRRLDVQTARLDEETTRLNQETARLKAQIAAIPAPVLPPARTPREELEQFARSHAIFFTEQTAFRDEAATGRVLDTLADLMKRDTSILRILGFTDDVGTPAKNTALSQARADAVAAALIARGVPPARLVALRRPSLDANISPNVGTGSVNRRVEFEVGFVGEGGP